MRLYLLFPMIFFATASMAQERPWVKMSGTDIANVLTGQRVQYSKAIQDFRASGRTLYTAGEDSWGYWAVRGDQYCSMWPPSDIWACYDMARRGAELRFIGSAGDVTQGALID